MKKLYANICGLMILSVFPMVAGGATYYNGGTYAGSGNQRYANYGYGNNRMSAYQNRQNQTRQIGTGRNAMAGRNANGQQQNAKKQPQQKASKKQGFVLDAGLRHEMGKWSFDMNTAGSILHYDNLTWNVIEGTGKYYFDAGMPMVITAGARYGKQFDESPMIDDDITNGGAATLVKDADGYDDGWAMSNVLSIGTSKGGSQMGFNVGIGLTDVFNLGPVKITPSVGYRYFKHSLSTTKNYGMGVEYFQAKTGGTSDTSGLLTCVEYDNGMVQCDPIIQFGSNGQEYTNPYFENLMQTEYQWVIGYRHQQCNGDGTICEQALTPILIPSGASVLEPGAYYFNMSGTTHKYDVEWAGPYVALDMEYEIDAKNAFNGTIELGLPGYKSTADQPYRDDLAHPTSFEDSASMGKAMHLGLIANWSTAVADSTFLTLGFTYDYYKVSNATATTYANKDYWTSMYDCYYMLYNNADVGPYGNGGNMPSGGWGYPEDLKPELADAMDDIMVNYIDKGFKDETANEINSIYKAMGIRIGLVTKF